MELRMPLHRAIEYSFSIIEAHMKGELPEILIPYLSGAPGGGKTASLFHECKKRNWFVYTINTAMERIETFGGIPDIVKQDGDLHTKWSVPEPLVNLEKLSKEYPAGVLFFDDWHRANPSVQGLAFELFTNRTIRGRKIPDNVGIILAGNDRSTAGMVNQFSAVMNRVQKILVKTDFDYWKSQFAYKNNVHPAVISFLDRRQYRGLFHGEEDMVNPWPSPRSWTGLSNALKLLESNGYSSNEKLAIIQAHVGQEAAQEFFAYYEVYSKFDIDAYYEGKEKFDVNQLDVTDRYPFVVAMTHGFLNHKDKANVYKELIEQLKGSNKELLRMSIVMLADLDMKLVTSLVKDKVITVEMIREIQKISQEIM